MIYIIIIYQMNYEFKKGLENFCNNPNNLYNFGKIIDPENSEIYKEFQYKLNNDTSFYENIKNLDYFKLFFNRYFNLSDILEEVEILEKNLPQNSNLESIKIFNEWINKEETEELNLENKNNEKNI